MELVSVVIPTHNAERFVTQAIDSVIAQTYPQIEIIVVDDGSQDDTLAVARSKLQKDFRNSWQVLELGSNRGPSAARNVGWRAAHGSWIQFLDSDDFLVPTTIERQIAVCADAPSDVAAVCSPWRRGFFDADQVEWDGPLEKPNIEGSAPIMCLVTGCRPLLAAGLTRRAVLEQIGGFDESLRFWECEELNFRIAKVGRFMLVPSSEPLYLWRFHRDKIYIGGTEARYRSTHVALAWIEQVLKATGNRTIDNIQLSDQDRSNLLDDCTMWGRLLYSQDRDAFNRYAAMARTLDPHFRPTNPSYVSLLSRYVTYESAEGFAQLARAPKNLIRKSLLRLKLIRPRTIFDWD
jgi:glycosyltransferase involved in cell wall biosynthesis